MNKKQRKLEARKARRRNTFIKVAGGAAIAILIARYTEVIEPFSYYYTEIITLFSNF